MFLGYGGVALLGNLREQAYQTTLAVILKAFCCGPAAFLDSPYQVLLKTYSHQDLPRQNIVRYTQDVGGDLLSREHNRRYTQDVEGDLLRPYQVPLQTSGLLDLELEHIAKPLGGCDVGN